MSKISKLETEVPNQNLQIILIIWHIKSKYSNYINYSTH